MLTWESILGTSMLAGVGLISYLGVALVVSMVIGYGATKGYKFANRNDVK